MGSLKNQRSNSLPWMAVTSWSRSGMDVLLPVPNSGTDTLPWNWLSPQPFTPLPLTSIIECRFKKEGDKSNEHSKDSHPWHESQAIREAVSLFHDRSRSPGRLSLPRHGARGPLAHDHAGSEE